ncbi:MAG: CYTH domain-containing protein [Candidatus Acidiferrales bacterium]
MPRNREIEIKLPVRDVGKLIARLRKVGAKRIGRVYEENTLFDTEDRQLGARLAILRIRREENADSRGKSPGRSRRKGSTEGGLLTYKGWWKGRAAWG